MEFYELIQLYFAPDNLTIKGLATAGILVFIFRVLPKVKITETMADKFYKWMASYYNRDLTAKLAIRDQKIEELEKEHERLLEQFNQQLETTIRMYPYHALTALQTRLVDLLDRCLNGDFSMDTKDKREREHDTHKQ